MERTIGLGLITAAFLFLAYVVVSAEGTMEACMKKDFSHDTCVTLIR